MRKKLSVILSLVMALQLILAAAPVFAEGETENEGIYTAPESPAVTYNMNLDWKYYSTGGDYAIPDVIAGEVGGTVDANGKHFYETDFDDASWETVSIPHAVNGDNAFMNAITDAGGGYKREVLLYRKTFTVPETAADGKVFFELEGIRQAAYVWVNGRELGYYEAGITAFGFDITDYVTPGEEAVIAICEDGTTARGTTGRIPFETVPGEPWGSSYTPDNYKTTVGEGAFFQWNTKDFNEAQIGLVYDAYLHVTGDVYQTFPLYNNLKTTGNYIYATDFNIRENKATINVQAEVRNESGTDGEYTLDVAVVDHEGKAAYEFSSKAVNVAAASDAGVVYETAVEDDAYSADKLDAVTIFEDPELIADADKRPTVSDDGDAITYGIQAGDPTPVVSGSYPTEDENGNPIKYYSDAECESETSDMSQAVMYRIQYTAATEHNEIGKTEVNTPDVTYITASYDADDVRFWSTEDPYLYTVYMILRDADGNAVDVKSEETGFRKVTYDRNGGGIQINDKAVWLTGYAQRATNEWAVIGSATDWLNDYDMKLMKENNANFIRWMHVAPKPAQVRSTDKYGIAIVCPAGDKEGTAPCGRQWTQRVEAMRDAMIYYRNSPSVIFWETGNSPMGMQGKAEEMAAMRDKLDPYGMRFIGARSTRDASELDYEYNYAGTMYGNYADAAIEAMGKNGIYGPIMETEYARDEAPRRVWDDYSPPDYDYVNKWLGDGAKKDDGYDVWDHTQEDATIANVKEYADNYYARRANGGTGIYSAAAMMVWSDSNMHGRNSGTENSRTSGRVDPVRQTKQMYYGTQAAQSKEAAVRIIGHWSYPEVSDDTYNYFERVRDGSNHYWTYTDNVLKRDPTTKTVYVIGSSSVDHVELYRTDGEEMTLIGTDNDAESTFIYQFDDVDVTKGDGVVAIAYDARNTEVARHQIDRTYDAVSVRLTPVTSPDGWKADGADIAYFDVEVIDENGNVCALNYDKINFKYEGEGEFLGGYNSGMGSGCFQNTMESEGLSNYFGGAKDGVSTIGKDYVYAENGTNRVFVKSTRNAGAFTLTASMDIAGMMPVSVTIESQAVETEGGLTTEMPSTWDPGVAPPPVTSDVPPMNVLGQKTELAWGDFVTVEEIDTTVYYTTTLNGEVLDVHPQSRAGINNMIFGPLVQIFDALKAAGAEFDYTYSDTASPAELAMTVGGHTYRFIEGQNLLYIDGYDQSNSELTEDMPVIEDGVMIGQINSMISKIPGVSYEIDRENLSFDITYTAE